MPLHDAGRVLADCRDPAPMLEYEAVGVQPGDRSGKRMIHSGFAGQLQVARNEDEHSKKDKNGQTVGINHKLEDHPEHTHLSTLVFGSMSGTRAQKYLDGDLARGWKKR
jgi:cytochrome P450